MWVEFTRDLTDKEVKKFLEWIAVENSEIDTNFSSSNKRFPILFAEHWKYPNKIETPYEFFEGQKINYDELNIQPQKIQKRKTVKKGGVSYTTSIKKATRIFTRLGQVENFYESVPFFYDKTGSFWLWNNETKFWERQEDEKDILNLIDDNLGIDTISSKSKNEIINALQQYGRRKIPNKIDSNWIQFKNGIIDLKNNPNYNLLIPSPKYFVTNPIPYSLGEADETPTMDKIFEEWVGEKYVRTLYEIIAYCLLPEYPIHRIFCFIGEGLNGKSKYLDLLRKFIGNNNVTSTELDVLLNSRFEVTRLYKKLVCQMGETNFNEMTKTSILKKLSGGDLIGFEYKQKTPFEDKNYAKIIISTNNLPMTDDKTIGFYRRWLIIDFPNRFSEKKDILSEIPEYEYNNLARKSVKILRELLKSREFTNEGTIEERMQRFEDRSNPLEKFMREYVEEDYNSHIWKFEFEKRLNEWCKENKFRQISQKTIGKIMKKLGIKQEQKSTDWLIDGEKKLLRTWIGLKWK